MPGGTSSPYIPLGISLFTKKRKKKITRIIKQFTMAHSEDLWKVSVLFLCSLFPSVDCQENGLSSFPKIRNSSVKDTTGDTKGLDIQTNCTINISDESKYLFTSMSLQDKYNFVHLKLEFDNFNIT